MEISEHAGLCEEEDAACQKGDAGVSEEKLAPSETEQTVKQFHFACRDPGHLDQEQ